MFHILYYMYVYININTCIYAYHLYYSIQFYTSCVSSHQTPFCHHSAADQIRSAVPRSKIMGHSSHRFEDLLGFSCCTEARRPSPVASMMGLPLWIHGLGNLNIKFGCTLYLYN